MCGDTDQQANSMSKEEYTNLFHACIQEMKPKVRAFEAYDEVIRLDLNLFENMSILLE
jgi:hypothetical protein